MSKLDVLDLHGNQVKFPNSKWAVNSAILSKFKHALEKVCSTSTIGIKWSVMILPTKKMEAEIGMGAMLNLYTVL